MFLNEEFQAIKPFIYENYQEYRILQPKVIFIHGLPQRLASYQELFYHLGNYGYVSKLSIQLISKNFYSCFAEFQTQVSACLAIVALDNFYIDRRTLKVSFASTKFCPNFLKGMPCYIENCNYAHYYIAQLAHLKDFAKQINHRAIAWNRIWQDYQQTLIFIFKIDPQSSLFPSGLSKMNELLFIKSQEFNQWQKKINQSLSILQHQLKRIKIKSQNPTIKSQQQRKQQFQRQQLRDDWLNIDDSISDFVQQDRQQNFIEIKNKTKTAIQQFLQEAQSKLMNMIFKSQLQTQLF